MDLIQHQLGILCRPTTTIARFMRCERRLGYGLYTVLLFGSVYTLGVSLAYALDHRPYGVPLLLRIPIEVYYLYEAFFLLPVTLCTWVMFAGLVRLLALACQGKGSFEDTLAVTGLPFVSLIAFMFIPDVLVDYALPAVIKSHALFARVINPARLVAASLWLLWLHVLAVRAVQQVTTRRALAITTVAYVPYMAITMTYMR